MRRGLRSPLNDGAELAWVEEVVDGLLCCAHFGLAALLASDWQKWKEEGKGRRRKKIKEYRLRAGGSICEGTDQK